MEKALKILQYSGTVFHRSIIVGDRNALSKFTNLQVLDMSNSTADDRCMDVLGTSCTNLR